MKNSIELSRGTYLQDSRGNEFLLEKSVDADIIGQNVDNFQVRILGQDFLIEKYKVNNAPLIKKTEMFIKSRIVLDKKDSDFIFSGEFLPDSKTRKEMADFLDKATTNIFDSLEKDEKFTEKSKVLDDFISKKPLSDEEFSQLLNVQDEIRKSLSSYALSLENNLISDKISGMIFCNYLENGLNDLIKSREIIKPISSNKISEDAYAKPEAFKKIMTDILDFITKAELTEDVWLNILSRKSEFNKGIKAKKLEEKKSKEPMKYLDFIQGSAGYKREDLPQITTDNLDDFLSHFKEKKIRVRKKKMNISSIKPAQSEINEEKIFKMIEDKFDWKSRIFIISADNFLLDGHHTWALGLEEDPDFEVNVWKISLPIKNLVSRSNRMKITEKVDIEGNQLSKAHQNMVDVLLRYDEDSLNLAKSIQSTLSTFPKEVQTAAKSILDYI